MVQPNPHRRRLLTIHIFVIVAAPTCNLKEVSTEWKYLSLDHTHLATDLLGDVVEITLQVKTTRGFHKVKKDAWGSHQHTYQKWGSQIAPNPTTSKQIKKFNSQWREYHYRRDLATKRRNGYSFSHPPLDATTPQVLKRTTGPTPSPVAEPLSNMALLSAGMLPLGTGRALLQLHQGGHLLQVTPCQVLLRC